MAALRFSLFIITLLLFMELHHSDHPKAAEKSTSTSDPKNKALEKQALASFKNACQRIQELADWMSILLKMKSMWARSVSKDKQERLHGHQDSPFVVPESNAARARSERGAREFLKPPPSCASLKNLQSSALTYVQWQAELVRIKALIGGNFLKNSFTRHNETAELLQVFRDRIRHLELMNRTSSDLLRDLKFGGEGLSLKLEEERARTMNLIREVGKSNDFLSFLRSSKDRLMVQLENLVETSEGLRNARDLMAKGELLQTLGSALDRRLMAKPVAQNDTGDT